MTTQGAMSEGHCCDPDIRLLSYHRHLGTASDPRVYQGDIGGPFHMSTGYKLPAQCESCLKVCNVCLLCAQPGQVSRPEQVLG